MGRDWFPVWVNPEQYLQGSETLWSHSFVKGTLFMPRSGICSTIKSFSQRKTFSFPKGIWMLKQLYFHNVHVFFSICIFLERSVVIVIQFRVPWLRNKIEENKTMREAMGRGPHTLEQDRGTRCQTDAGVRHYLADCTLLQSEESWEVFKDFQPQHPFFKQNLTRKPNLQNRQKEVGKRGEGKGSLDCQTCERGSGKGSVRSLNLLNGQFGKSLNPIDSFYRWGNWGPLEKELLTRSSSLWHYWDQNLRLWGSGGQVCALLTAWENVEKAPSAPIAHGAQSLLKPTHGTCL